MTRKRLSPENNKKGNTRYKLNIQRSARACRTRNKNIARNLKEQPCADCRVTYPYYVMDFDHVRGIKVIPVARLVHKTISVKALMSEIDKCEVVCANCHRIRTFNRRQEANGYRRNSLDNS